MGRDEEKTNALSDRLTGSDYLLCDFADMTQIEGLFQRVSEKLDGLVYCVGINRDIPIRSNNIEALRTVSTVNYMSFVEMLKFFLKKSFSNDGASVVAISSSAVIEKPKGMCTYVASKAAMEAAVSVAAKESSPRRIRVNAIEPGFTDTEMVKNSGYISYEKVLEKQSFGFVDPLHIAFLVDYLLSEKATYITGAIIPITGGI